MLTGLISLNFAPKVFFFLETFEVKKDLKGLGAKYEALCCPLRLGRLL
jgi:hypothetical protein